MASVFLRGGRLGGEPSDMNGTLLDLQSLSRMETPWSRTTRLGFPEGSQFWVPINLIHLVPNLIGWVLTRAVEPIRVLNFYVFAGFLLTGLSAYWIARALMMSFWPAVFSGVLVQMLPWFTSKAANHIFYTWYFVPLGAIALSIQMENLSNRSWRNLVPLTLYLLLGFFIDTYLFVIAIYCVLIIISCSPSGRATVLVCARKLNQLGLRLKFAILCTIVGVAFIATLGLINFFSAANNLSVEGGNPARGITSSEEIERWAGSISDYVTPGINHWIFSGATPDPGESDFIHYGGVVPLFFVGILFVKRLRRNIPVQVKCIGAVTLGCILASLRPIDFLGVQISLNSLLKFVMPGIRVFSRFAAVGQALVLILAIYSVITIINAKLVKPRTSAFLLGAAFVILAVDLSPRFAAPTYTNLSYYSSFQQKLFASNSEKGLLIPDGKLEAIDLSLETAPDSLDWPIANDLRGRWRSPIYLRAGLGSHELAAYLHSREINYVIARTDSSARPVLRGFLQDSVRANIVLQPDDFKTLSRQKGMDGQEIVLLEVRDTGYAQSCQGCRLAQLLFSPILDTLGASQGGLIDGVLWSQGQVLEFHSELIEDPRPDIQTFARIELVNFDQSVEVVLETSTGRRIEPVSRTGNSSIFEIDLLTFDSQFFRASQACSEPVAGPYCWGIGQFVVFTRQ